MCIFIQVPKLSDGQQNAENQKALPDVVGSKKQVSYKTEIIGGVPIVTQTQVKIPAVHHIENAFCFCIFFWLLLSILVSLVSFPLKHEGGDGADRAEREAMHRSHSQLPYFLCRPAQEHTVIKSGYCVKQGAVVSAGKEES